jgi:hypothetical protein
MRLYTLVAVGLLGLVAVGCSTPAKRISGMQLGMTPLEVREVMGEPDFVRASKVYDDGQSDTVWEYTPNFFEFNPKFFWIQFRNDRVVQWGEPGDWAGKSGKNVPAEEYRPSSSRR